jgi:carboxypeptidase Taq
VKLFADAGDSHGYITVGVEPGGMAQEAETEHDAPGAYDKLLEHVREYTYVGDAAGVLRWDQEVMMPEGGTPARAKQLSTLSTVRHDMLTADDLGALLGDLDGAALSAEQAAVVREVRRQHERAVGIPSDLVQEISETTANALPIWEEAKAEDDFDAFADSLREIVRLKREYAEAIDPDRDPYAVLFEEYEPYLGLDAAERILATLRDALVPLIDDVADSDVEPAEPLEGAHDEADQEALVRAALEDLGYDWERGRLDTAPHPFSTGSQFDARVTTRFSPDDPLDALGSTVHEFGHATYTLGLPDEHYGTPLGSPRDLSVHESQSRLWENHVGRSRPFWDFFAPRIEEHLGVAADPRALYEAANTVDPTNLIRVEADELTYHMHVVLRFEIERDLVHGNLDVSEVPAVWNEMMAEYLGVRPEGDEEGCLQDIHWTHGSLGYFPTYSLGSVMAAQLFAGAEDAVGDLDGAIRRGEFGGLHEWLTEEIHRHGCRFETDELVERATGAPLSAEAFLEYADEKYRALYDC